MVVIKLGKKKKKACIVWVPNAVGSKVACDHVS